MRLILEWGGPPPKMTGVLIRGDRERHTGRMPCEDRGRDWSDVPIRQGMSRIAGQNKKLEERQGGFS